MYQAVLLPPPLIDYCGSASSGEPHQCLKVASASILCSQTSVSMAPYRYNNFMQRIPSSPDPPTEQQLLVGLGVGLSNGHALQS